MIYLARRGTLLVVKPLSQTPTPHGVHDPSQGGWVSTGVCLNGFFHFRARLVLSALKADLVWVAEKKTHDLPEQGSTLPCFRPDSLRGTGVVTLNMGGNNSVMIESQPQGWAGRDRVLDPRWAGGTQGWESALGEGLSGEKILTFWSNFPLDYWFT